MCPKLLLRQHYITLMQKRFFKINERCTFASFASSQVLRGCSALFNVLLFSLILLQGFGPGVGEGVCADAFLLLLFAHVVLDVAFAGGVAFFS